MASPLSTPVVGNEAARGILPSRSQTESPEPATGFLQAFLGGDGRVVGLERYGTLAARLLISQIFILSGIMKILDPARTAAQMEGRGMFWIPFFLWAAAAVELAGGHHTRRLK